MIALTLCVLMTALCLTVCGGKGGRNAEADDTKSALPGGRSVNEAEGAACIFNEDGKGVRDAGEDNKLLFVTSDVV